MKKIISICALIIVAAIVVTVFTACGSGKNDKATTTAAATTTNIDAQNNVVVSGLSLKINETSADVYNDGVLIQTLKYPQGKGTPFSFEYAKEHYGFLDMNFDGEYDVYIAVADDDGIIYYYCWLYNATAKEFQYSPALSDLKNISVDGAEQIILAIGFDSEGNKVISKYTFVNGSLSFIEKFNETDEIPEDIVENMDNNAIGNKPVEGTPSVDTSEPVTDNTTGETKPLLTTEPNSGGGIVLVDPTDEVWY